MFKRVFLIFLLSVFAFSSLHANTLTIPKGEEKSKPVVDNSADEASLFEATDNQLEYTGIDTKSNSDILSGAYDDTELREAIKRNEDGIKKILSKLTSSDGWTEHTLPDGTKIRMNANGDIEVWDPITGKWIPLSQMSKEDQDRILNQMLKSGLITPTDLAKIKEKLAKEGWTEHTLPDGTKIRMNANGDIEVWDPITGKWIPLSQMSKEDQDRILNQMLKSGLITPTDLAKIKEKLAKEGWTEHTLPDGTKIRMNANGDIEVWDPITGKWIPLSQMSKEDQDRILNQMLKSGLITPTDLAKIKEKLAKEGWTEHTLPDGTKIRMNANGDIEVWDPITGKWIPLSQMSKEDQDRILNQMLKSGLITPDELKKIQARLKQQQMNSVGIFDEGEWDALSEEEKQLLLKKQQEALEQNQDNELNSDENGGVITYYDEEGNKKTYVPIVEDETQTQKDKTVGQALPLPKNPTLNGVDLNEAISVLSMINKNIESVNSSKSQETQKTREMQKYPILEQMQTDNQLAIDKANAQKASKGEEIRIVAFCDLPIRKDVISAKESMETYCRSDKIGSFVLVSELSFETKDNRPELIASAKDLSFSITGYVNDENYTIKESLVLNAYTSNRNIATVVNMKRLEKYLAKTGKETFELVKGGVDKYTEALSASLEDTSTETSATTGDKTVSSNSKEPILMDYLTPVGVQVAMAFIGNGLEVIFSDSPIVASVYKDTKLKVYLTLTSGDNKNDK